MVKTQTRTLKKAANLLAAVESTLSYGRPRKRPGKDRPLWNSNGQFSLVGALKSDAKALGYSKTVRDTAERYIGIAAGIFAADAAWLDEYIYDTRELQRIVHRARRNIEKQSAVA